MAATQEIDLHVDARKSDHPAGAEAVYSVRIADPLTPDMEPIFECWLVGG